MIKKIVKNSIFSILGNVITFPIYFFLVPYMLKKIGSEGYGLWALTGIISSYQVFVEFGFTATLVRYIAKENADNNIDKINEYLSTTLNSFLILWGVLFIIIFVANHIIVKNLLGIKSNLETGYFLVFVASINVLANLINGLFKSIYDGIQRLDISNIMSTIQVLLSALGTFGVLEKGYGLKGLGYNLLFVSVLLLLSNFLIAKKILQGVKLRIGRFDYRTFKELLSYSVNLQVASLLRMFVEPLNKILISHFFSIDKVGYYEIALRFSGSVSSIIRSSLNPIFPAASEINHRYGLNIVDNLRRKSNKFLVPIVVNVYIFILLVVPYFISIWLGNKYVSITSIMIIIFIGSFFSILNTAGFSILNGIGYAMDVRKAVFKSVVINIIGSILGAFIYGFNGFCLGYLFSMIYGYVAINNYYQKRFYIDEIRYMYLELLDYRLLLPNIIVLVLTLLMMHFVPPNTYFHIMINGVFSVIIYLLLLFVMKVFKFEDIRLLFGKIDK